MLCMTKKRSTNNRVKMSEFCLELPNAIFNYDGCLLNKISESAKIKLL